MTEYVNAEITNTFIGLQRGCPTCQLHLKYAHSGQAFGGHDLRHEDYGIEYIMHILAVLDKASWEDLPGTLCRVTVGENGLIESISHIIRDKTFNPKDLL